MEYIEQEESLVSSNGLTGEKLPIGILLVMVKLGSIGILGRLIDFSNLTSFA